MSALHLQQCLTQIHSLSASAARTTSPFPRVIKPALEAIASFKVKIENWVESNCSLTCRRARASSTAASVVVLPESRWIASAMASRLDESASVSPHGQFDTLTVASMREGSHCTLERAAHGGTAGKRRGRLAQRAVRAHKQRQNRSKTWSRGRVRRILDSWCT